MFIMTYLEHTTVHRLNIAKQKKISKKHPAFKDESGNIKKVVLVRRRLM